MGKLNVVVVSKRSVFGIAMIIRCTGGTAEIPCLNKQVIYNAGMNK